MYDYCNYCCREHTNCVSAINILRQIANLVCGTGHDCCQTNFGCQITQRENGCQTPWNRCGCQTVQTGTGNQTTGTGCGCQYGYPVNISGRIYVSQSGWCNGGDFQTAQPYGTNGYCQTPVTYGSNVTQNGVYGGTTRRCGCLFNSLNS